MKSQKSYINVKVDKLSIVCYYGISKHRFISRLNWMQCVANTVDKCWLSKVNAIYLVNCGSHLNRIGENYRSTEMLSATLKWKHFAFLFKSSSKLIATELQK